MLEFEDANRFKKRLESLISLEDEASINVHPLDLDIWHGTFESSTGIAKISVRDGKVKSTKTYFIKSDESSKKDEAFRRVVFHNYLNKNQFLIPLDLKKYAHIQLLNENITSKNIDISNLCTYESNHNFHSWRKSKTYSRQWNFISS